MFTELSGTILSASQQSIASSTSAIGTTPVVSVGLIDDRFLNYILVEDEEVELIQKGILESGITNIVLAVLNLFYKCICFDLNMWFYLYLQRILRVWKPIWILLKGKQVFGLDFHCIIRLHQQL